MTKKSITLNDVTQARAARIQRDHAKMERSFMSGSTTNIARTRTSDPASSHKAARRANASGKAASDMQQCLEFVRQYPGLTSRALAERASADGHAKLDRYVMARRLPDLERRRLVIRDEKQGGVCWFPAGQLNAAPRGERPTITGNPDTNAPLRRPQAPASQPHQPDKAEITMPDYAQFLTQKQWTPESTGFDAGEIHPRLKAFQRTCIERACQRGRSAIFADCGLGKTFMELEFARRVGEETGKPVLLLAPLAVGVQTLSESARWDIDGAGVVRSQGECDDFGICITNYEMLQHFDPDAFGGIVLDESSILKAYGGKFRQAVTAFAERIPYRLACSATPAPNDTVEVLNHAEFLGIARGKEVIGQFFIQDGNTTQRYRLRRHAVQPFYRWMAGWATACRMPSDLGDSNHGYVLPQLHTVQHTVGGSIQDGLLFSVEAKTLMERKQARRESVADRVALAAEIANNTDGPVLVWCGLNDESKQLNAAIPDAVEVTGSDDPIHKVSAMLGFTDGTHRVMVTKPSIGGWGMNWQHCATMIFVGLSDSFEEYYQALRRCYRFGQENEVTAHVICAETEGEVVRNIQRKQRETESMMDQLVQHMNDAAPGVERAEYHRPRRVILPDGLSADGADSR